MSKVGKTKARNKIKPPGYPYSIYYYLKKILPTYQKHTNVNLLLFYSTKMFFYSDDSPYSQRFFKVIQREK